MPADYALIEFNYERPAVSDIVEIWDDEAGVRTLARDSKGFIHTMFCGDTSMPYLPVSSLTWKCTSPRASFKRVKNSIFILSKTVILPNLSSHPASSAEGRGSQHASRASE